MSPELPFLPDLFPYLFENFFCMAYFVDANAVSSISSDDEDSESEVSSSSLRKKSSSSLLLLS